VRQLICEWCGWLPQNCPCQPDTPETRAVVEARHAAAVRLAMRRPAEPALWKRPTPTRFHVAPERQRWIA